MKKHYRSLLLSLLLASSALGCAASQPRYFSVNPAWTIDGDQWDLSGLTVVTFAQAEDSDRQGNQAGFERVEKTAINKANQMIAVELAQAYIDYMSRYHNQNLAETEVLKQVNHVLRGVFVKHRYYDQPQQLYYVQAFIPLHRVHSLFKAHFNADMYITGNGEFRPR